MKVVEVAVIAVIFCFVAVAATYLAFNGTGFLAGADDNSTITDNSTNTGSIGGPDAPFGCVSGIATDKYKNGMPGVTVTLWETSLDNATGNYVNERPAAVSGNPQVSNGDPNACAIGTFQFFYVPPGTYNVTAEKDGDIASGIANVTRGTATLNLCLLHTVSADVSLPNAVVADGSQVPAVNGPEPAFLPPDGSKPWCTLAGVVTDKNRAGIPGATVTLWECHANGTGWISNDRVAGSVGNNPQATNSNASVAAIGSYTFYGVPCGNLYNVTAVKLDAAGNPHMWFAIVNATLPGTHMNNIALPDLVISSAPLPTALA